MKNEKGITLIALIITIIVMLILVGVTINVALNGGLFGKADNAKKLTQKEVDKEMLLSAVVATVDKSGNFQLDQVQEYLPEGEFTYNSTTKVYKSKTGNEFTINETTGKVEEVTAKEEQNTNTEENSETEVPQNISNPWTERRLSSAVKYDKKYYSDDKILDDVFSIDSMTLKLTTEGKLIIEELEMEYDVNSEDIEITSANRVSVAGELLFDFSNDGLKAFLYDAHGDGIEDENLVVTLNVQN